MEDTFCVAFQPEVIVGEGHMPESFNGSSGKDESSHRRYLYAGIFDGHGGKEASLFARDHLLKNIVQLKDFWSADDEAILRAIREGFITTHFAMLRELDKWPKTTGGLPSTSGTTASICFIMHGKIYTGHVGDSRIVLGRKNRQTNMWIPRNLTRDHKPDCPVEKERITKAGGEVMTKSGVERVVWFRPKNGHKGPIRRSTNIDKIPFLAVARSLGDLWSYNPDSDTYVVSPEPDLSVVPIDPEVDKCLIIASDGLWNMLQDYESVRLVQELEEFGQVDCHLLKALRDRKVLETRNPAHILVNYALQKWKSSCLRADNTSAVALILSPSKSKSPSSLAQLPNHLGENVSCRKPVLLPFSSDPAGFLVTAVDPELDPELDPKSISKELDDDFGLLSPSMQSLYRFAGKHNPLFGSGIAPVKKFYDGIVTAREDRKEPMDVDKELADIDFSGLIVRDGCTETEQKLQSFLHFKPILQKSRVVNGVTVLLDYDDSPTQSAQSTQSKSGKVDKACSVNEGLMDDSNISFTESAVPTAPVSPLMILGGLSKLNNPEIGKIGIKYGDQIVPTTGPKIIVSKYLLSPVMQEKSRSCFHSERVLKPVEAFDQKDNSAMKCKSIRDSYFLRLRGKKGRKRSLAMISMQTKRLRGRGGMSLAKTAFKRVSHSLVSKSRVLRARKSLSSESRL